MSDFLKKRMQHILDDRPLPEKKKYTIPKVGKKRAAKLAAEKEARDGEETDLVKWFKARIKYSMTGYCEETGLKTETNVYEYAIMSCCHILPKRHFKSVMLHPLNFVELIPDMHHKFDNISWKERKKMNCWPIVWKRLLMIYDGIDKSELYHLPAELREEIEKASNLFN